MFYYCIALLVQMCSYFYMMFQSHDGNDNDDV